MKRTAATLAAFLILGISGLAEASTLRPTDQDGLNLRAGPGTAHRVLGALAAGQSARVLGQEGEWIRVRTASGQEGWVSAQYSRFDYADEQAFGAVNTDVLNVRAEPNTGARVLAQIKQNEQVRLLEATWEWWRVRLANGTDGWVAAQYMKRVSSAPQTTEPPKPAEPPKTPPQPPKPTEPPKPAEQPPQPPPPPPPVPSEPPPAPAWTVPLLKPLPPAPAAKPAGNKEVVARTAAGVYEGRNPAVFRRVDTVGSGEALTYLDAAEGWVKVRTPRGRTGWVSGTAVYVAEGKLLHAMTEESWSVGTAEQQAGQAPPPGFQPVRRAVRDADGLRLRSTPSTEAPVLTVLPQGAVMEVLQTQAPWLRVKSPSGQVGWVHGEFTVPVAATPAPAPATTYQFTGAFRATLQAVGPGVLRLEVTAPGKNIAQPLAEGATLRIPLPTGQAQTAVLPVGAFGARSLTVDAAGVTLATDRLPGWQVTEQSPGRVVLLLRPHLEAVGHRNLPDRTVYEFRASGQVSPRISAGGGNVVVEVPGAVLTPGALPQGVRAEQTPASVKVTIASNRSYTLKRTEKGFDLHLYAPGLAGKTILLDPGHGGGDVGAVNRALGIRESDINLKVSLWLRSQLSARGANVMMTRASDNRAAPPDVMQAGADDPTHADLGYRTSMANELNVDLFVSVHHNADDGYSRGVETFYTGGALNGGRSAELARLIQKELVGAFGRVDRGAKNDLMYVTRNTEAPAVLVELGFIDHPAEGAQVKLSAFQEHAAMEILQAIEQFYAERTN